MNVISEILVTPTFPQIDIILASVSLTGFVLVDRKPTVDDLHFVVLLRHIVGTVGSENNL